MGGEGSQIFSVRCGGLPGRVSSEVADFDSFWETTVFRFNYIFHSRFASTPMKFLIHIAFCFEDYIYIYVCILPFNNL